MIRSNQARRILRSAAFSVGLLLMAVPAAMAGPGAGRAVEQDACAAILGLDRSDAGYDACISSLDSSLSAIRQQNKEAAACSYVGLGSTVDCEANLRANELDTPAPGGQ